MKQFDTYDHFHDITGIVEKVYPVKVDDTFDIRLTARETQLLFYAVQEARTALRVEMAAVNEEINKNAILAKLWNSADEKARKTLPPSLEKCAEEIQQLKVKSGELAEACDAMRHTMHILRTVVLSCQNDIPENAPTYLLFEQEEE